MKLSTIAALAALAATAPAAAMQEAGQGRQPQTTRSYIIFYDQQNFNGREYRVDDATSRFRWNYTMRSIGVHPGDRWEICARPRFEQCVILDRSVTDTTMLGIPSGSNIGSVRPAPSAGAPAADSPS